MSKSVLSSDAHRRVLRSLEFVADYLQVDQRTVCRMATRGELTLYRVGKQLRLDMNEVEGTLVPIRPEDVSA